MRHVPAGKLHIAELYGQPADWVRMGAVQLISEPQQALLFQQKACTGVSFSTPKNASGCQIQIFLTN